MSDSSRQQAPPTPRTGLIRVVWVVAGAVCFGLGVLGAFLPVLPTTPLMLLAAACWARASPRLHAWLLASPTFGPTIRAWQHHRGIPRRARRVAVPMVIATFAASVWALDALWGQVALGLLGAALATWLMRLPVIDAPS